MTITNAQLLEAITALANDNTLPVPPRIMPIANMYQYDVMLNDQHRLTAKFHFYADGMTVELVLDLWQVIWRKEYRYSEKRVGE